MWRARRWACPVTLANLRKLFITSAITTKTRPHPSHPQRQGASARRAPEDDDENTIVCQTVCIALSPVAHHTESSYNKCTESQQVLTTLLTLLNNVVRTCDHHHADNHDHWLHSGCTPRPSRARPRTTAVSGTRSPTRPRPRAGRRPCRQTHNRHIRGQDRQVATHPRHAPTPAPARRRCARTLVPCPALYSVVESEGDGHHMYAGAACAYRVSAPPRCMRFSRAMISDGDD